MTIGAPIPNDLASRARAVNSKSFTYTLNPKAGKIKIEIENSEDNPFSLDELHEYKVRVSKFMGSSTYAKSSFVGAASASYEDIHLDFYKGVCGDGTDGIIFKRVQKTVGERNFYYLIQKDLGIPEAFFMAENNNSIESNDPSDHDQMVKICGDSTTLAGKNITIAGNLMLNNVVMNGHDDGTIGIGNSSSSGIIQNVNITSEGGVIDIDGEVNVRGNQAHPLEFLAQAGTGLFVDGNASIDTSSSEEVSSISGNFYIHENARISGQITFGSSPKSVGKNNVFS